MNPIESLAAFREKFNPLLNDFLRQKLAEARRISPAAADLVVEIQRMVKTGGKRVRPAFMYYGYKAAGGQDEAAILYTCQAIEFLHTFALIHDDIIDRSDRRRGQPTVQRFFEKRYPRHIALSAAILAGDLAFVFADATFTTSPFSARLTKAARKYFDLLRAEVAFGEYLDVLASRKGHILSEKEVLKILEYKSGKYTIERPLHLGAALAGAPPKVFAAFSGYGIPLGQAFQIQDDILGMFGREEKIGKPADSDIKEGKKTILVAKAYERADSVQRLILDRTLGNPRAGREEVEAFRRVVKEVGAYDYTVGLARRLVRKAKKALSGAPLEKEGKGYLLGIADFMLYREY